MELVTCTPADLPDRMLEIQWQAMWRYYLLPAGRRKTSPAGFEASARAHAFDLDCCVISVDEGMDAGFCWVARRGEEAWCGGFGVRPEFRKRGIGVAMLRFAGDLLRERGVRVWRLEVVQQNPSAQASYLRAGFRRTRDLALYRGKVERALDAGETVADVDAQRCLDRYVSGGGSWPQVRRTWGAGPDVLRRNAANYHARELRRDGEPVGFMLFAGGPVDIGLKPGEPGESGLKLLATLPSANWGNVPDDDPVRPALDATRSLDCWVKQWEMEWTL